MASEIANTNLLASANLLSYYKFEGNANDSKGSVHGSATGISYGVGYGRFNQGASLNGTTSQIDLGNNLPLNSTDFSISFHIYVSTLSGWDGGTVIGKVSTAGNENYWWVTMTGSDGKAKLWTQLSNGTIKTITTTTPIIASEWNHIVLMNDADGNKVAYVNGVVDTTGSGAGQSIGTNTLKAYIGRADHPTVPFRLATCYLDDIGVFNRLLTATEINELGTRSVGSFFLTF